MNPYKHYIQGHPLQFTLLAAFITVLLSALLVFASLQGWPRQVFQFTQEPPRELPEGTDIAGWAWFDRDSYVAGEPIKYRARVVYRSDRVVPDFNQFVRSVSFLPIEKREYVETHRGITGSLGEYTLDYILQGVDVAPHTTYQLDPAVLFYKRADSTARELLSLHISAPPVFFTQRYPGDVSKIPLKELKGEINGAYRLRQAVIGTGGTVLLGLGLFVLWRHGRRRKTQELSETERLWQEFHEIDKSSLDPRNYLLKCEKIITRIFQARAGLSPVAFWLHKEPDEEFWKNLATKIRQILDKSYRPSDLAQEDADNVADILNDTFSKIVFEDRLKREAEPSLIIRLKQQPRILAIGSTCFGLAIVMFSLAVLPELWLSPDLVHYNNTVRTLSPSPVIEEAEPLVELGSQSEDAIIKAAAYYNAGTIKGHIKPSGDPPMREQELLEVVFLPEVSLDAYIDNEESVEMLFASAGWLREAKDNLQDAVRADPYDEDIIRNLELISKRHAAVVAAINSLFADMNSAADMKTKSKLETMVDVLNLEWPEEVENKEEEDKKAPTYKISERF